MTGLTLQQHIRYGEAILEAQGLLEEQIRDPEGEANPEYARGIVELIAMVYFGTAEAKSRVAQDIGLPDVSLPVEVSA